MEDFRGPLISYLPLMADGLKEARLQAERRHQRWLEEERRRQGAEAKQAEEERRRKELIDALNRWRLARDIRAFVAEAKQKAGVTGVTQELENAWTGRSGTRTLSIRSLVCWPHQTATRTRSKELCHHEPFFVFVPAQ